MTSSRPGTDTLAAEVLNISAYGIRIFVRGRECFLDCDSYPWFREAKVADILHLALLSDTHLHWPKLDVDLELESLDDPEKYPLTYR